MVSPGRIFEWMRIPLGSTTTRELGGILSSMSVFNISRMRGNFRHTFSFVRIARGSRFPVESRKDRLPRARSPVKYTIVYEAGRDEERLWRRGPRFRRSGFCRDQFVTERQAKLARHVVRISCPRIPLDSSREPGILIPCPGNQRISLETIHTLIGPSKERKRHVAIPR